MTSGFPFPEKINNMSEFKQKVLAVLHKLQELCDVVDSYKHDTRRGISYCFGDMFPPVKGQEELQDIVRYFKKNRLDISITFPIWTSDPNEPVWIKKYGEADRVPLGLIKGKNIETIQAVIRNNIDKLNPETDTRQIQTVTVESSTQKTKQKFTSNIKMRDNFLYFGEDRIPTEVGQKSLAELFLTNAKVYRGKIIVKNGRTAKLNELQTIGGYGNNRSIRDGLKKLRRKLRKVEWPVEIINTGASRYQMVIK